MNINRQLLDRIDHLLMIGDKSLATTFNTHDSFFTYSWVSEDSFHEFKSACLSFILGIFGKSHPYYSSFEAALSSSRPDNVKRGIGILRSIKVEVENGWLITMKGIVSAEVFNDFIEMAQHLLTEGYKDPAAVIIGSVLEEHLRQLCTKNDISIEDIRNEKVVHKKADTLNAELANKQVYNKLDQKNITAWLDLRNKAAHGKYIEYNRQQVELLLSSVTEFIARTTT